MSYTRSGTYKFITMGRIVEFLYNNPKSSAHDVNAHLNNGGGPPIPSIKNQGYHSRQISAYLGELKRKGLAVSENLSKGGKVWSAVTRTSARDIWRK